MFAILGCSGLLSAAAKDLTTLRQLSFDFRGILVENCFGETVRTSWRVGLQLLPSAKCSAMIVESTEPELTCVNQLEVFEVAFVGGSASVLAESVAANKEGVVFVDTFEPWARSAGDIAGVQSITKRRVCRDLVQAAARVPASYCTESRMLAVNFNFETPLNNRILTNGFSFKIVENGIPPARYKREEFASEVRNGFQGALTQWSVALADNDALLTPAVRHFVASRTSRSDGGYTMLLPPQVVQVQCTQNATFIIRLEFKNSPILPQRPLMLARAKIEGRTIALNMAQFKCYRSEMKFDEKSNLRFELDDGCFNMLPILTHELGHAFGMSHHDPDPTVHAIMDPSFSRDALSPRPRDVVSLVSALERTLTGATPGELDFMESNGVAPPAGVVEYREP
ncbi:hypothetical protein ASD02_34530 [Ensifer sp. Root1252]|nr:hypothetical protein ASD02_34530 [Ensifer sp. Root1252]